MRKLRRSLALVVVAAGAMVAPTVPAAADPGSVAAQFTGAGVYLPGITILPTAQSVATSGLMTGTFVAGPNADWASINCNVDGTITGLAAENLALGATCYGSGVVTGFAISLTCTFTATITHPPLCFTLTGLCAVSVGPDTAKVLVVFRLCFIPTNPLMPFTSFQASGELAGAGT